MLYLHADHDIDEPFVGVICLSLRSLHLGKVGASKVCTTANFSA